METDGDYAFLIFATGAFGILDAYFIYWYIKTLNHYQSNDWDFREDYGPKIYNGDISDDEFRMTPEGKIRWGYPSFIITSSFFFFMCIYMLMNEF